VECSGTTVSMSRNSNVILSMIFENEKEANLWATKVAVAGGNSESISKLFSIQRSKIQELEQHTEKAQIDNDEVERCLNFLSREYVDMRYQVRSKNKSGDFSPFAKEALYKSLGPQPVDADDLDAISPGAKEETEPSQPKALESQQVNIDDLAVRHQSIAQSEPEKEPLDTPRPWTQLDMPRPEIGKPPRPEIGKPEAHQSQKSVHATEMPKQGRVGQRSKITTNPLASRNTRSLTNLLERPQRVAADRSRASPSRGADRSVATDRTPACLGVQVSKRSANSKSAASLGAGKR